MNIQDKMYSYFFGDDYGDDDNDDDGDDDDIDDGQFICQRKLSSVF